MRSERQRKVLVCSCERSMPNYGGDVARGCPGAQIETGDQFCGAGLDRVQALLSGSDAVTIGCTQQAPLFTEIAEDLGFAAELAFANIRENAGWSDAGAAAGPKAAALLAMAAEPVEAPAAVPFTSEGVILIYGRDETAIEVGRQLADKLDVTVLLSHPDAVTPHRVWDFPVAKGTIRTASGHLGAFELTVDDFALPSPSSRDRLRFGTSRDGAVSKADIVLDLTGGTPLFPAHELRGGYLWADPADRAALAQAIAKAADLVGEFDKPRFVSVTESLCAHSRSGITGCTRCLDVCPTGAIAPDGDHAAFDTNICAGCGSCVAVCPTGAVTYTLPPADALLRRLRTLLAAYRQAGGRDPVVLFHDAAHGVPLIEALARFGTGLPANVLPVALNEITQLCLEAWAAPVAWGASAVRVLGPVTPRHDRTSLTANIAIANLLTEALGYGPDVCGLIEADDIATLCAALGHINASTPASQTATFLPLGTKRNLLEVTMAELHRVAPAPVDRVTLPAGAPFGGVDVNVEGCTLCLSCVSACPTGALSDSEEKPALYFTESACVQCGLCAATCPENVITLRPQVDFAAWRTQRRAVKVEEPFHCINCGKPFGTKSTIEKIAAKLEGRHWMFTGENARRIDVIRMCDTCRIEAATNEKLDPYASQNGPEQIPLQARR